MQKYIHKSIWIFLTDRQYSTVNISGVDLVGRQTESPAGIKGELWHEREPDIPSALRSLTPSVLQESTPNRAGKADTLQGLRH